MSEQIGIETSQLIDTSSGDDDEVHKITIHNSYDPFESTDINDQNTFIPIRNSFFNMQNAPSAIMIQQNAVSPVPKPSSRRNTPPPIQYNDDYASNTNLWKTEPKMIYTYSRHGSRENSNHNSDSDDNAYDDIIHNSTLLNKINHILKLNTYNIKIKKFTRSEVAYMFETHYGSVDTFSNEMNTLLNFIQAQKNIYLQSTNVTYIKLYSLIILALTITGFVTVITPFIESNSWNVVLITSCNAFATLIISITRYLNLEFTGCAFSFLANTYEKCENSFMNVSNKLVTENTNYEKTSLEEIRKLEFKMNELNTIFTVVVPSEVKKLFPFVSHINIFLLLKEIKTNQDKLFNQLKNIKNELIFLTYILNQSDINIMSYYDELNKHILFLTEQKEKVENDIRDDKKVFDELKYIFTKEIQSAENLIRYVYILDLYYCFNKKPKYLDIEKYKNPIIKKNMEMISKD
jgi:hypothetical protein